MNHKQVDGNGSQLFQQHDISNQPSCSYYTSSDDQLADPTQSCSRSRVRSIRFHQEISGLFCMILNSILRDFKYDVI